MKTTVKITDAEIIKGISKLNFYSDEQFNRDAVAYVKAIKERRMCCVIYSVSNSGISRNLAFKSCEKGTKGYYAPFYYRNWNQFFIALGFSEAKEGFRIGGCGMDMVFHTNYSIIHKLKRIGILNKKECESYCQMTPTMI